VAQRTAAPEPRAIAPRGPLLPHEQGIVNLFEATAPSVAYITTEHVERTGSSPGRLAGRRQRLRVGCEGPHRHQQPRGAGRAQGHGGARCRQPDGSHVVGTAPDYDLAVVKLTKVPKDLKPIPLGARAS
jgi:2-alkenal reductase